MDALVDELTALPAHLAAFDATALHEAFRSRNEFLRLEHFLPGELLGRCVSALDAVDGAVHRSFIPGHKKGGSVSCYDVNRLAPVFGALYRDESLNQLLQAVVGRRLEFCPPADPHSYALYYYTEPGDHIGYHYDTSYYAGIRYTLLLGLVDDSSCRLECEHYAKLGDRDTELESIALAPGMMVLFNGDNLRHRITPAGQHERRVALTFEYVTDTHMHPGRRFVSNMKDAIAYFGFRKAFGGGR